MLDFSVGRRFGRLIITGLPYKHATDGGYFYMKYPCKCDCGGARDVRRTKLKSGEVFHCGCVRFTKEGVEHESHEFADTPIWRSWLNMKQRCTNTNSPRYHDYGGRGITIDPRWDTFVGFYNDMGDTYEEGLSIDRIDVNGNYCKENCRWANDHIQGYNRRISNLNTSGKTGVAWHKATRKWYVRFTPPDNQKEIGELYEYLWDAVYRRMQLEQLYHGKVKD